MHFDLLGTTIALSWIGVVVLNSNSSRSQNQAFALMSAASLGWLVSIQLAFAAGEAGAAAFWISSCAAFAAYIPWSAEMFRLTIHGQRLRSAIRGAGGWFLISTFIAAYCFTPLYIGGAILVPGGIPEQIHGSGFIAYPIYLLASLSTVGLLSFGQWRRTRGLVRIESGYLTIACVVMIVLGVTLSSIIPALVGSFQSTRYSYLWVASLTFITAYGISSARLMSPSVVIRRLCAHVVAFVCIALSYFALSRAVSALMGLAILPLNALDVPGLVTSAILGFYGRNLLLGIQQMLLVESGIDVEDVLKKLGPSINRVSSLAELSKKVERILVRTTGSMGVTLLAEVLGEYAGTRAEGSLKLASDDLLIAHLCATGKPFSADQALRHTPSAAERECLDQMRHLNLSLAIPVLSGDRMVAVMAYESKLSGKVYTSDEIDALMIIAEHLGIVIENASLFSEVEMARLHSDRLMEGIGEGLVACSSTGDIKMYNRRAREILPGERGPTIADLPLVLSSILKDALESRYVHNKPIEMAGQHLLVDSGSYDTPDGARLGAFILAQDVTERVSLQKELSLRKQLCTLFAEKAHDLKVPIATLKIFAELLPHHLTNPAFQEEFTPVIMDEVRKIDRVLLEMIQQERFVQSEETFDLRDLLAEVEQRLRLQARSHGVSIVCDTDTTEALVYGHRSEIREAVINLGVNAIQSLSDLPDGRLVVRLKRDHGHAIIAVEDNGPGIRPDDEDKLFQPFFTTKRHQGGTGMGLFVARQAAVNAQGDLRHLPSEKGALFHLSLPITARKTNGPTSSSPYKRQQTG
jgi:signal transduction histidine kinase/GAF domain-containing protein